MLLLPYDSGFLFHVVQALFVPVRELLLSLVQLFLHLDDVWFRVQAAYAPHGQGQSNEIRAASNVCNLVTEEMNHHRVGDLGRAYGELSVLSHIELELELLPAFHVTESVPTAVVGLAVERLTAQANDFAVWYDGDARVQTPALELRL